MGLFHHAQATIDRGAEAESIRERLAAVPLVRPCDRARAEAALAEHLTALELAPRPVRWIEGADAGLAARDGFLAFWAARYKHGKPEAPGMTSTGSREALFGSGLVTRGQVGLALEEEKQVDRGVRRTVRHAVFGVHDALTRASADDLDVDVVGPSAGLALAMSAARAALAEKGIVQRTGFVPSQAAGKQAQGDLQLEEEVETASAPAQALEAANWLARTHVLRESGGIAEAHDRLVDTYRPLVDAVEAGLWLFWVTDQEVIAVAAPEH